MKKRYLSGRHEIPREDGACAQVEKPRRDSSLKLRTEDVYNHIQQ